MRRNCLYILRSNHFVQKKKPMSQWGIAKKYHEYSLQIFAKIDDINKKIP
jgi:hypothetical protein